MHLEQFHSEPSICRCRTRKNGTDPRSDCTGRRQFNPLSYNHDIIDPQKESFLTLYYTMPTFNDPKEVVF